MSEETLTADAVESDPALAFDGSEPAARRSHRAKRRPVIGLAVQFSDGTSVLPAILQRQSRADGELWDVTVFLAGATSLRMRPAVPFSATGPKVGHWNFLPVG